MNPDIIHTWLDEDILQRNQGASSQDGGRLMQVHGRFDRSLPTNPTIQWKRINATTGTDVSAWTTGNVAYNMLGGMFCITEIVPTGRTWWKYKLRYIDDSSSEVATNRFCIGVNIVFVGQSNVNQIFKLGDQAPQTITNSFHKNYLCDELNGVGGMTSETVFTPNTYGCAAILNAINSINANIPILLVNLTKGGSAISEWVDNHFTSAWGRTEAYIRRRGGDAEFVAWIQGETDAGLGTSQTSYETSLRIVQKKFQDLCGRSDTSQFFIVTQIGTPGGADTAGAVTIRAAQSDYISTIAGVCPGGTLYGLPTVDGTHVNYGSDGCGQFCGTIGAIVGQRL